MSYTPGEYVSFSKQPPYITISGLFEPGMRVTFETIGGKIRSHIHRPIFVQFA